MPSIAGTGYKPYQVKLKVPDPAKTINIKNNTKNDVDADFNPDHSLFFQAKKICNGDPTNANKIDNNTPNINAPAMGDE